MRVGKGGREGALEDANQQCMDANVKIKSQEPKNNYHNLGNEAEGEW